MIDSIESVLGFDVSRETLGALNTYCDVIRKWNPSINLVSRASLDDLWRRHILDSAQLYPLIPKQACVCLDIGSGGGLPGIVLAILSRDLTPTRRFTLVESDQRKATFLREVCRTLSLSVDVLTERIESIAAHSADLISARALAPLSNLLGFARQHLAHDGVCLFPKGETWLQELEDAQRRFSFEVQTIQSQTDPKAKILKIQGVHDV